MEQLWNYIGKSIFGTCDSGGLNVNKITCCYCALEQDPKKPVSFISPWEKCEKHEFYLPNKRVLKLLKRFDEKERA